MSANRLETQRKTRGADKSKVDIIHFQKNICYSLTSSRLNVISKSVEPETNSRYPKLGTYKVCLRRAERSNDLIDLSCLGLEVYVFLV